MHILRRSEIHFLTRVRIIILVFVLALLGASYGLCASFVDAMGRCIDLNSPPKRIVSLAPSITEILYLLGLGDKVVGVTTFSYYPPEAKNKPTVGSYVNLNAEKIISLAPDLAIGTIDGNQPSTIKLLERACIKVYLINPRKVAEVIDTTEKLAILCGVPKRGRIIAKNLEERVKWITNKTHFLKKRRVFLQINLRPIMSVNKNTIHNDIIQLAGGINITKNAPTTYPRVSIEEIIQKDPQIIIISSMERGGEFEKARRMWFKWSTIDAVKNRRIYLIDSDIIDRPSPRIIDGLEKMARMIHPSADW